MDSITYTQAPDNTQQVMAFIGDKKYTCTDCGGYGEYEGEYGPVGCQLCNSRLLSFHGADGKVHHADWGDTIVKTDSGLILHGVEVEE